MKRTYPNFIPLFRVLAISLLLFTVFLNLSQKAFAVAGINRTINFQGKLVNNPTATNVSDTSYTVVFTIYDRSSGGTALWTETQTVTTADGIFRVALGSQTPIPANFNFNWDGLYLGMKVNADSEMTPRIQLAAVPYAFNAEKVSGLTVQDTSGNASTSGTLQIANGKTINLGTQNLTLTTTGDTTITLPTSGTLLTNTATAVQTITSTQTTGTVLGVADSTGLTGSITGLNIALTSSTNSQNKTGISFDLSGGTGGTYYDLLGSGSTWSITRAGVLSVASCSGCGGGGTNYWNLVDGNGVSNGGYITPINSTADFFLGAQSTASAKFAVLNLNSGTPVASIAGHLVIGQGSQIRSQYDDLNLAYKSGGNAWTTGLVLQDNTGFVGIGTSNPTALLHLEDANNDKSYQLVLGWTGNEYRLGRNFVNGYFDLTGTQGSFSGYRFYFDTTKLSLISEASTGNIGLGIGDPISELHVTRPLSYGANGKALAIFDQIENQDIFTASKGGVTKFVIDQNGNASVSGNLTLGLNSQLRSPYDDLQLAYKSGGDAWTTGITLQDVTGRVGIGTTNPVAQLDVFKSTNNYLRVGQLDSFASLAFSTEQVGFFTQMTLQINAEEGFLVQQGVKAFNLTETSGVIITGNTWSSTLTVDGGGTINSATSGTLGIATTTNTTGLTIGNSGMTSGITFNVDGGGPAHYVFQKEGSAYTCSGTDKLTLNGSGQLVCGADQSGGGGGLSGFGIDATTGTTFMTNNTTDVLFGGTSTSSASLKIGRAGNSEPILKVGSTTTRGSLDIYGDVVKYGYEKNTALTNINDVFIYDTTTDSNQGAWRNSITSQQLSWYTEAKDDTVGDSCNISTEDRCGEGKFPRKAILATTNDALYIFDQMTGKMWMKFTQSGGTFALGADTNNNPSGVFAINGVIYVGTNGSSGTGLYAIDFVTDRMYRINTTNRSQGDKNIANRNTTVTYATDANTKFAIIDNVVNDIDGMIIQGSVNYGNGIILIVAATDTGVSVINLNRPSVNHYSDVAGDDYNGVQLTKRGYMYVLNETQAQLERWTSVDSDTVSEIAGVPDRAWDQTGGIDAGTGRTHGTALVGLGAAPTIQVSGDDIAITERNSMSDDASDSIYVGTDKGLSVLYTNYSNESTGLTKYYTKDYITDLLYGGVKAYLPFHNTSGDITDVSYKANVFDAKGTPAYADTDGVRGNSMVFDNSNDMLCSDANNDATCDQDTDYDMGAAGANTGWYVSVWFKHSSSPPASDVDTLFSHGEDIVGTFVRDSIGWAMWMDTAGRIIAGSDDDTTQTGNLPTDIQLNSGVNLADNQWHHAMFAQISATDRRLFIDGKQASSSATSNTVSLSVTDLVLSIGGECSNVACTSGTRFWDGRIDDFEVASDNGILPASTYLSTAVNVQKLARRKFLEGNAAIYRRTIDLSNSDVFSSNTIGLSTQSWIANELVGSTVEITGGTGVGQTRRIVANTTTTMTVSPSWTTTPDGTSDFAVKPEELYGATDTVKAVGLQDSFIGEHRKLYIGTNDGSDGGGVTVFNNVGSNFVSDAYHSGAGKTDDSGSSWSGTDYDDIQALADTNGVLVFGSLANIWTENEDTSLQRVDDLLGSYVSSIRLELRNDGLGALTPEQGYVPGADLAEKYSSTQDLSAGEVVAIDDETQIGVVKSTKAYQGNILGIVATDPGLVLGSETPNSYPIALVGRVPVRVTTENGMIKKGDFVTSSTLPGYAMKADKAGRVLGQSLEDLDPDSLVECGEFKFCGVVTVFVNLSNYLGENVEVVMDSKGYGFSQDGLSSLPRSKESIDIISENGLTISEFSRSQQILNFLRNANKEGTFGSEIFTTRVSATGEVISPLVMTDLLIAKKIKADSIEGLELFIDKISSLKQAQGNNKVSSTSAVLSESDKIASIAAALEEKFASESAKRTAFDNTDLTTIEGRLRVKGNGLIEGILSVVDTLTANNFIANGLSTFFGDVVLKGNISFEGRPTFNSDTAGFAVVKKDADRVEVTFEKEYENVPVISTNITFNETKDSEGKVEDTKNLEEKLFRQNYSYAIVNKSNKGFVIVLNKRAQEDIEFSWLAISVKDAKLSISKTLLDIILSPTISNSQDGSGGGE